MQQSSKRLTLTVTGTITGVARNFDWEGALNGKSCDVSLITFFGNVITMMS